MHYNLALIGFGNVARALARLFLRKQDLLKSQYDITFSFTGIATGRHGFAVNPDGLDIKEALELVESGKSISPLSTFAVDNSLASSNIPMPISCSKTLPSTRRRDNPRSITSARHWNLACTPSPPTRDLLSTAIVN